ncbi:MAG: type II toxin-antitoxin system YafQ family toxin [Prevotella sp.]|nr:type II toxin-antitoxin system YafQ family toxin [Prevotella sp.]
MPYNIKTTKRFEKDVARCKRRSYPMHLLREVLAQLAETGTLPAKYRPHILVGNHSGEWEAHIKGDWLITWNVHEGELTLLMLATGTHADLF